MLLDLFRSKSNKDEDETSSSSCEHLANRERKAFSAYAEQSHLPSASEWPSSILITPSRRAGKDVRFQKNPLPMNGSVVEFDGPSFSGKMISRIRDTPDDDGSGNSNNLVSNIDYFSGRSRTYQWSVQGRFKRRIRFDKLITGQEFDRPFRNKPSNKMVNKGLDLLRSRLPQTFEMDLFTERPRFEHPLLAGCQKFRIDRLEDVEGLPGSEMYGVGEDGNVIEDSSLLNDDSVPSDGVARRKFFSVTSNLEKHYFELDLVYTFDFYANFFSAIRHRLELTPFFSVDLIPYFNGYPLFMSLAKDKDTQEYLWATEMWHKRLLDYDESPGRLARWFSSSRESEEERKTTEVETEVEEEEDGDDDN